MLRFYAQTPKRLIKKEGNSIFGYPHGQLLKFKHDDIIRLYDIRPSRMEGFRNQRSFRVYTSDEEFDLYKERMFNFIESGRLPISPRNLSMIPLKENESMKSIINKNSKNSDLTIIGFRNELVKKQKLDIFEGYKELGNILFVNSIQEKRLNNSSFLCKKISKIGNKNYSV